MPEPRLCGTSQVIQKNNSSAAQADLHRARVERHIASRGAAASGRAQLHCGIASGDSDRSPGHWQQGTSDHHRRLARAPTELGAAVAFAPRVRSEPAFRVSSTSPSIFTSLVTEEMPVLSTDCCQDPKRERPSGSGVASEGVGLGSEAKRESGFQNCPREPPGPESGPVTLLRLSVV